MLWSRLYSSGRARSFRSWIAASGTFRSPAGLGPGAISFMMRLGSPDQRMVCILPEFGQRDASTRKTKEKGLRQIGIALSKRVPLFFGR
jgi:hypothetical protein